MTPLLYLLAASVALGLLVGWLAKMPPKELVGLCAVLCLGSLGFYGLVLLL